MRQYMGSIQTVPGTEEVFSTCELLLYTATGGWEDRDEQVEAFGSATVQWGRQVQTTEIGDDGGAGGRQSRSTEAE